MLEYIIWAFAIYWGFRFVFDFMFPVFRATRQMRDNVRGFQNKNEAPRGFQGPAASAAQKPPQAPKPSSDDYIDFEEIK